MREVFQILKWGAENEPAKFFSMFLFPVMVISYALLRSAFAFLTARKKLERGEG